MNSGTTINDEKRYFGFWAYLMSDCLLFGALFAAYAVLRGNVAGGPAGSEIFSLPFVFGETLILLTSSFTAGLASLAAYRGSKRGVLGWLTATFALGAAFLAMEMTEFTRLVRSGNGPQRSGFLTSYFTLVGTHGLHIAAGLLWMAVLIVQIAASRSLTPKMARRVSLLGLFWHFLDIVWIFIFTIVYLMGVM